MDKKEDSISQLDLPTKIESALNMAQIKTISELTEKTEEEIANIRGIGIKGIIQLDIKLGLRGLSLKSRSKNNLENIDKRLGIINKREKIIVNELDKIEQVRKNFVFTEEDIVNKYQLLDKKRQHLLEELKAIKELRKKYIMKKATVWREKLKKDDMTR